ncbi:MAG: M23 family metallopeptidase, partial [Polyangiales bacterium]
ATAVSPPLAQSGQASPVAATGGTEAALSPALGHAAVQPEADPLPMRPAMRPGALARPVIEAGAKVTAQGSGGGRMLRFVVRERTPVRAVAQGQVTQVQSGGPGARVVLAHDDGLRSVYEGVQQVEVRAGDRVGMGAQLGRIDAAHALRFRLQQRGRTVDAGVWLGL